MNEQERRTLHHGHGVALEERADKSPRIIGYGAVFYNGAPETEFRIGPDFVERVLPGAFDDALKQDDVRGLFNHNPAVVLGRTSAKTMELSVDKRGLRYDIDPPDTQAARDVVTMVRRGDVTGSSFLFRTIDENYRRERRKDGTTFYVRELKSVKLFDVGPVTFPAYEGTDVQARDADAAREALEQWQSQEREAVETRLKALKTRIAARLRVLEIDEELDSSGNEGVE